jgi:hypothetical protein
MEMKRNRWRVLRRLSLAIALVFACQEQLVEPMPREKFIEVMVALRNANQTATSASDFDARKAEILAKAGVTDSLLLEFVRAQGGNEKSLALLWDSINARLNVPDFPPEESDTSKPPSRQPS